MGTNNSQRRQTEDEDFYGYLSLTLFVAVFAFYAACILEGVPS